LITAQKSDAIATFHQMALLVKGKSILSCIQMESHDTDINEKPHLLPGGKQRILMDDYQKKKINSLYFSGFLIKAML
jgi:hypothetical protein